LISLDALLVRAKAPLDGANYTNVRISCDVLYVLGKILLWVGEKSPNVAGDVLEGLFEALGLVLVSHMGFTLHNPDVTVLLISTYLDSIGDFDQQPEGIYDHKTAAFVLLVGFQSLQGQKLITIQIETTSRQRIYV
jgi:hypothetical protein